MDDPVDALDAPALQRLVERQAAVARSGRLAVALARGQAVAAASAGGGAEPAAPIGCVAKLLTATLVLRAAERGRLGLESSAAELLGAGAEALRGVTVRHLLEHTHGLDDSLLAGPVHRRGFIDSRELLARLAALARFAAPGALYSYGNAGAWLLAVLLERLHGCPFAALVRAELLAPLGIDGVWHGSGRAPLCAATGVGLSLSAEELVRFGLHALGDGRAVAAAAITPLPGWHPLERGICLGWKYAGEGWFGHQSVWPGASLYLRVQPQRELALAVAAGQQAAAIAALGVFGKHFPELFAGRTRLPAGQPEDANPFPVGVYEQSARAVAVAQTPRGLVVEAWERDERGRRGAVVRAALVRSGGVLLAQPASGLVPYLEVVRGPHRAAWLWNGRVVLRRAE